MSVDKHRTLVHYWVNEVWNAQNFAAVDVIFAPSYCVNGAPVSHDAVKQAVASLHQAFAPAHAVIEDMIVEGNKVVVRWSIHGTHSGAFMGIAPTGQAIQLTGINIYRIENNQFVANDEQVNALELMHRLQTALL